MGALMHGLAGMLMSIAWFIFFDGFQIAKNKGADPFTFVDWVPGLVAMLGWIFVSFVNFEHVLSGGSDDAEMFLGGGDADESAVTKSKFLFLFGYFLEFAGLGVGIWRLADPYAKDDSPSAWPGVALLLQVVLIAASATACLIGRKKVEEGLMYM